MRDSTVLLNEAELVRVLRKQVERAGGQSMWARQNKIDRTVLNKMLNGYRKIPKSVLTALSLERVYVGKKCEYREDEVLTLLQSSVRAANGPAEWARRKGISRSYLSRVLHGKNPLSPSIVSALALQAAWVKRRNSGRNKSKR